MFIYNSRSLNSRVTISRLPSRETWFPASVYNLILFDVVSFRIPFSGRILEHSPVVCDKEMASFATKEKRKGDPYHNHDNFSALEKKENFSSGTSSSSDGDYKEFFLVLSFILSAFRNLIIKRLFSREPIPPIAKPERNKSPSMAEGTRRVVLDEEFRRDEIIRN